MRCEFSGQLSLGHIGPTGLETILIRSCFSERRFGQPSPQLHFPPGFQLYFCGQQLKLNAADLQDRNLNDIQGRLNEISAYFTDPSLRLSAI